MSTSPREQPTSAEKEKGPAKKPKHYDEGAVLTIVLFGTIYLIAVAYAYFRIDWATGISRFLCSLYVGFYGLFALGVGAGLVTMVAGAIIVDFPRSILQELILKRQLPDMPFTVLKVAIGIYVVINALLKVDFVELVT